ncbi:MAG: PQQ-binding-like beta-propeller repeat protein [Phycisphaerales bacterium]|nr:PQQ-binding-like beta-propeller repeat protein [Phycisphaerales bacterium]
MPPISPRARTLALTLAAGLVLWTPQARAQGSNENPAYIADSPRARDAIASIPRMIEQGNLAEASRLASTLITTLGDQLVESTNDPLVYIPVRGRIHNLLLDNPGLLEQYRIERSPAAQSLLANEQYAEVFEHDWLTEPGFIASLRLAQVQLESARFHDAERILRALFAHPDASRNATSAAMLARELSRYLDTDLARSLADRWADIAGIARLNQSRIPPPPDRFGQVHTALPWKSEHANDEPRLGSILPRPLHSADLSPIIESEPNQPQIIRRSGATTQASPWTLPASVDGSIFTNDGFTVSCFDRFTLALRWRLTPEHADEGPESSSMTRQRMGRLLEDSSTVTIDRDSVFAALGLARGGTSINEGTVIRADAETGRVRWSVDLARLDPSLEGTTARGSIVVDDDTVVLAARKNIRQQRLIGMNLIGLDRHSGALKWIRPIGSSGALPYQQAGQIAHSGILHEGVVYWSDAIGLLAAIESDSGRVRWVRRLPEPELYTRQTNPVWTAMSPTMIAGRLFTLSPTGDELFEIDPETGHQLARRTPQPVGQVQYMVRAGNTLACVAETEIAFYPVQDFETASPFRSLAIGVGEGGILGRVVEIGDRLAVPLDSSVMLLDPHEPNKPEMIALDSTGNILPLDGQVVVVDDSRIHSYLSWEIASQILTDRIRNNRDPDAAITLAQLALSSGEPGQILPAVDDSIRLTRSLPSERRPEIRDRLFGVLLEMVAPTDPDEYPSLESALVDELLDRMGTLASTSERVVAHRMALGAQRATHSDYPAAIGAYQDILTQRSLRTTMWQGNGFRVRAELEASKRIHDILRIAPSDAYQIYDKLAQQDLGVLSAETDPDLFEQLARSYPWSVAAADAWARASSLLEASGNTQASIHAAQRGLAVAEDRMLADSLAGTAIIEQLAGTIVSGLVATNRSSEARAFLLEFSGNHPSLVVRSGQRIFSVDSLASESGSTSALPVLGDRITRSDSLTLIAGSPISAANRADPSSVIMFSPQYNETRLLAVEGTELHERWSRVVESPDAPLIPWQDHEKTLAIWSPLVDDRPATAELIDSTNGRSRWILPNLRSALCDPLDREPDEITAIDQQISTPVEGIVPIDQILVVTDGLTVVLSDRVGRAMGIDMESGRVLWHAALPVNQVFDLDISGSTLAVCGSMVENTDAGTTTSQITAVLDARTGEPVRIMDQLGNAQPKWVRVTQDNTLIASNGSRIVSFGLDRAELNWVFVNSDNTNTGGGGWAIGPVLYVLDDVVPKVFAIDLATGVLVDEMITMILNRGWVDIRTSRDRALIASPQGLLVYDSASDRVGQDALGPGREFADAAFGLDRAVLLRRPELDADGRVSSTIALLSADDGRLIDLTKLVVPQQINRQPTSIEVVDGMIIVGFGEVSIVLHAPTDPS